MQLSARMLLLVLYYCTAMILFWDCMDCHIEVHIRLNCYGWINVANCIVPNG